MAGIADAAKLDKAKSAAEAQGLCNSSGPGISYARIFAESGARGDNEREAHAEMVKEYGEGRASSLQAICWFLYWGSFTGNTLNGILGLKERKEGMSLYFKVTFFLFYGPLFFILINVVSLLIKPAPRVPAWFSALFGVILATIAGLFFFPLGVLGFILDAMDTLKAD